MMKSGGGKIINITSRGAFRGEPNAPAYGASKAGLNAMSQSLAQYLAPYNIFVGVVAPGFVETDMARDYLEGAGGEAIRNQSPLQRVAQPEEVAYPVLFLASEGAEWLTGAILDANGASYLRTCNDLTPLNLNGLFLTGSRLPLATARPPGLDRPGTQ